MSSLNELLTQYWPALTAHLIKKGMACHDADDCVQSFVLSRILEGEILDVASRDRGKFRGLLMTALDRHISNWRRGLRTAKRAPDNASTFGADEGGIVVSATRTPHDELLNEWGKDILATALVRMRHSCSAKQQDAMWGIFEGRVLRPITDGAVPVSCEVLADRFGFESAAKASNALVTAKRTFSRVLREVMVERGASADEIEQELKDLETCLGGL